MGGGATRPYGSVTVGGASPLPASLDPDFQVRRVSPRCLHTGGCRWSQSVCLPQQEKSDPLELLRRCEKALGEEPPRFHRNFTSIGDGENTPDSRIRVMQWNILAQGQEPLMS